MFDNSFSSATDRIQGRLLLIAAFFVVVYATALTLSPAVRDRSWQVEFRWNHWIGVLTWLVAFYLAHRESRRLLPDRDPYLLSIAGLLSGWGLMTVWRLFTYFGLRQTLWLAVAMVIFILCLRLPGDLRFLRRYKYLWLTGGLLLTALTLLLGTNPLGYGPRMWLGCCGIYFQPSEPLKLLLIVYLAAYLAGFHHQPVESASIPSGDTLKPDSSRPTLSLLPLLAPTLIMTGLALGLLIVQRDLGTASIFLFLYAVILYLATSRKRVLLLSALAIALAATAGYLMFEVVRVRIDAWFNPWLDPSGRSYQIVQSLLAIANGGLLGRGPGLGSPNLVPVPHSDFIFAALAEEGGLVAMIVLVGIIAFFCVRGFSIAFKAPDPFRRYLAAGLTTYLVAQSILIIGGNIRLLPLTGVTLPFVSYGGSSLLTAFISLLLLLHISNRPAEYIPAPLPNTQPYLLVSGLLILGLAAAALTMGWWSFYRGPDLLNRTDNARRAIADRHVRRGSILERSSQPLAETVGAPGEYSRLYNQPELSPVIGYTHPVYGQSGIEASMDDYLRGLRGYPRSTIWWNHLMYGEPPEGRDIRLTIDPTLQQAADQALADHLGAVVLMDAGNGELLAMASHPTFDANQLDEIWNELIQDDDAPLLNRATLGRYPTGALISQLLPEGTAAFGLDEIDFIRLPTGDPPDPDDPEPALSPLQVALAASVLSADGTRPAPKLVNSVNTPLADWVLLPTLSASKQVLPPELAQGRATQFRQGDENLWQLIQVAPNGPDKYVSWYVAGTLPGQSDRPLAIAVLLEEDNPMGAKSIGNELLQMAVKP